MHSRRILDSLSSPLLQLRQQQCLPACHSSSSKGAVTQQREQLFIFQMELTKPCQYYGEDLLPGSTSLPVSPEIFLLNPPHLVTLSQQETISLGKNQMQACMGIGLSKTEENPNLYLRCTEKKRWRLMISLGVMLLLVSHPRICERLRCS